MLMLAPGIVVDQDEWGFYSLGVQRLVGGEVGSCYIGNVGMLTVYLSSCVGCAYISS